MCMEIAFSIAHKGGILISPIRLEISSILSLILLFRNRAMDSSIIFCSQHKFFILPSQNNFFQSYRQFNNPLNGNETMICFSPVLLGRAGSRSSTFHPASTL